MSKLFEKSVKVGLRIDVDTYRGTRLGVPRLLQSLSQEQIKASFFFSVGPDNMGRHLWRLLKPAFLLKMLRSSAVSLYGWDILLRGTFWPGKKIGANIPKPIKATSDAGHEIGFHTWDHHAWQSRTDSFSQAEIHDSLQKGSDCLTEIVGSRPVSSAVAGWRCNDKTLLEKESFSFHYNSDCRGYSLFRPVVNNQILTPQIPVTLPTFDEVIGKEGITIDNYNRFILSKIKPGQLNVYTIHAEVEGIIYAKQFDELLQLAKKQNIQFVPLGALLDDSDLSTLPDGKIINQSMSGREGWISCQK
ncbi:MAG: 4-deoxy-4-formamido-L-arabinose-phosphoundecaprenol deformylase [gamma proteobacterium symbiont of Bathyaustriella thionipta]|nr:4-deoxy-4-formamido-L-arabinose-phosphoundecaprenol deformylase [gamma proteobacterium symbiont of Bathyaustriella thionipta]MCU7949759.1 4-deoxy-4-formamido-L-arabinose-phosphoundecaprenol deformylase [gamma proteobacterium symbiont of Bathyaustriella thionipta]MCU7953000.1 4-deoxy-4-formamido-L-arabinose-phosphoundecaprenol deformylase [gamma proteobacterium symbiont of Bathyaustriella thionipta]MCU7956358.1 4-deoxy-4-formamido-L-arabinose-phosphoundecaprenol deformylase [gamma proteobacter